MNNYNNIAGYYDRLAKLVFGNSQVNAQKDQLKYLPSVGRILIVGGGTGWILEEISQLRSSGLILDYVEVSSKMIDIAQKREVGKNVVNFFNKSIQDFKPAAQYNVVITSFLFDNFEEKQCEAIFLIIHSYLEEGGNWLFCDFDVERDQYVNWKNILMRMMYLFFKIVADVKPSQLTDVKPLFKFYTYEILFQKWYYKKFIYAAVYRKLNG